MGMTMSQKILAAHAGINEVKPGQLVEAGLDLILGNDITAPIAIEEFAKLGAEKVFDKNKVAIVPGNAFCVDENEKSLSFRMTYATPSDEQIEKGVEILKECYYKVD